MKRRFDINDELEELVIRYNIDRFHPRFSKRRKARLLMAEFFGSYKDKNIIIIASCQKDSDYVIEDCGLRDKCSVVYYEDIEDYPWDKINVEDSVLIIVSFCGRRETMSLLYNKGIAAISIYDYLIEKELYLDGNYYDVFGETYRAPFGESTLNYVYFDINSIFFYDRRNYEIAHTEFIQEMYLSRMIFDCVYIKDWELVEKYIDEYIEKGFPHVEEYMEFKKEVHSLLDIIKKELALRKEDDIAIFWLDSLEFGEDSDMSFLKSISETSLDFLNAYTVTPFTNPTAKTLFSHKYVVDDRSYKSSINRDCTFIDYIENEFEYEFRFYTHLVEVEPYLKGRLYQNMYTTLAEECWNMINDILNNEKKLCVVLHEVIHTHQPFYSFGLQGEYYFDVQLNTPNMKKIKEKQGVESRRYVDNVLRMYVNFLPENTYKIFMSDHGHTEVGKFHTIFRVLQKNIAPAKIGEMFSYINFDKLIYKILRNEDDYSDIVCNYALIQDVYYYNAEGIKQLLRKSSFSPNIYLGYKGVVTNQHHYIRYNDGSERYYNNHCDGEPMTNDQINYLRKLCTEYPKDIINDEKYKHARNLYATIQNYNRREGKKNAERLQAIIDLFNEIPDSGRLAIRGGGKHTWELWFALGRAQQEKIAYVIDNNKQCMAARLGLKVISIDEVKRNEIDTILISSYENENVFYDEMLDYVHDIEVIRLYEYLEKKGLGCEHDFYKIKCINEDIVWEE